MLPLWMSILLIVGLSVVIFFIIRPLKVLTSAQWITSHLFLWLGLWIIMGYVLLTNLENTDRAGMLMGGIWTLAGGMCFVVGYIVHQFKKDIASTGNHDPSG